MICSYIPPCREHSAWQMLGLFLCVTLNVSEWHLTDDTLLVEQVLVARTIFREQRSKNGSVISRSDFSLSQDLSPLLSLLTNSHGNEKAKGCFPNPQQKSHGIWDTEHRPSPERGATCQRSFQIHPSQAALFLQETSALQQFLFAQPQGYSGEEQASTPPWAEQHCAFLATLCGPFPNLLCANTANTNPVLRKMWENLSWTGRRKQICAGLSSGQLDYPGWLLCVLLPCHIFSPKHPKL